MVRRAAAGGGPQHVAQRTRTCRKLLPSAGLVPLRSGPKPSAPKLCMRPLPWDPRLGPAAAPGSELRRWPAAGAARQSGPRCTAGLLQPVQAQAAPLRSVESCTLLRPGAGNGCRHSSGQRQGCLLAPAQARASAHQQSRGCPPGSGGPSMLLADGAPAMRLAKSLSQPSGDRPCWCSWGDWRCRRLRCPDDRPCCCCSSC